MNTEVLQIVAATLIQNVNGQNGLYNEYLFIKTDKILRKTLNQDWNSRNTHWKTVRNEHISLHVEAPVTVLNDIHLDASFRANTASAQQKTTGPEDIPQLLEDHAAPTHSACPPVFSKPKGVKETQLHYLQLLPEVPVSHWLAVAFLGLSSTGDTYSLRITHFSHWVAAFFL